MRSRRARQFPGKPSTILADKSVHPWTLERYESLFECFPPILRDSGLWRPLRYGGPQPHWTIPCAIS